jgi:lysophospholipase L1-like esterase
MLARGILGLLVLQGTLSLAIADDKPVKPWHELADGDRVVFIGGTFIEREGNYGWLETLLTVANAPKKVTFRNLGWSGDTVWGESRAYFGKPPEGYKNLLALVTELKPTVIYLNYGNNEAHAGEAGIVDFTKQFNKLLDDLTKIGNPRIIVIAPLPYEAGFSGFEPTEYNKKLEPYQIVIKQIAAGRKLELITWAGLDPFPKPLTIDGQHYDSKGYYLVWQRRCDNLLAGYLSKADIDKIKNLILAKNELFFHRWRPANTTYLTGFRKHEQGQNAKEIAQFDPLVSAKEEEIWKLLAAQVSAEMK